MSNSVQFLALLAPHSSASLLGDFSMVLRVFISLSLAAALASAQAPGAEIHPALKVAADSFAAIGRGGPNTGPWPDFTDASDVASTRQLRRVHELLNRVPLPALRTSAERILHANLLESVEGQLGLESCRLNLWATMSQLGGWHVTAANWARSRGTSPSNDLAASMPALRMLPGIIAQHKRLLQRGLDSGFVSSVAVIDAVVQQLDALVPTDESTAPLMIASTRSSDSTAAGAWRRFVADSLHPAIRDFRVFLAGPYRARARRDGSLASLPNGTGCYANWLRQQTSVSTDPTQVMREARATYDATLREMTPVVQRLTGAANVVDGMRQLRTSTTFAFPHRDSILPEYQRLTRLAEERLGRVISGFTPEPLDVLPYSKLEEQADLPPRYNRARAGQRAQFLVNLGRTDRMSSADATAHEAYPGHHLQAIASQQAPPIHPAMQRVFFGSYGEGWGIYSEELGDEMGLYDSDLLRTGYLIHLADVSMAIYLDVGHHVLGWSREQLVDSMMTLAGRGRSNAEAYADRHSATPGQLATYYVGWRLIRDARRDAERALGNQFDVRAFHYEVLKDGSVSLAVLKSKVQAWIAAEQKRLRRPSDSAPRSGSR